MIILTLSNKYTDHALALHEKILILDAHSDIGLDVITRRSNYESKVADTIHFPKLKKGLYDRHAYTTLPNNCFVLFSFLWGRPTKKRLHKVL